MHQFKKVRPKNSDSAADASTEATEAEAEVADPATERDTVNEQDLKMQEWDDSVVGLVVW